MVGGDCNQPILVDEILAIANRGQYFTDPLVSEMNRIKIGLTVRIKISDVPGDVRHINIPDDQIRRIRFAKES